jgi:peptidoglycan/xylan/chitin deacetylase (PgdA/CDA1 family)
LQHDDGITQLTERSFRSVADSRRNPNGCPVRATMFTTEQATGAAQLGLLWGVDLRGVPSMRRTRLCCSALAPFPTACADAAVLGPSIDSSIHAGSNTPLYLSVLPHLRVVSDCDLAHGLWRDGYEIATHTKDHAKLADGTPKNVTVAQILGARSFLSEQCGIPEAEIRGFRNPYCESPVLKKQRHCALTKLGK